MKVSALTLAAAVGVRATGCVISAAFKEVNIVGLSEGLTTIPGPVTCAHAHEIEIC